MLVYMFIFNDSFYFLKTLFINQQLLIKNRKHLIKLTEVVHFYH